MTSTSQCDACIHLDRDSSYNPMRCEAFPDGIPIPIQANKHDHSKPYPGDHGILYEQIRPGPRIEVAVQAILEGWRRPSPQTPEASARRRAPQARERGRVAR